VNKFANLISVCAVWKKLSMVFQTFCILLLLASGSSMRMAIKKAKRNFLFITQNHHKIAAHSSTLLPKQTSTKKRTICKIKLPPAWPHQSAVIAVVMAEAPRVEVAQKLK